MCTQFMIQANLRRLQRRYGARVVEEFVWKPHVFPRYPAPVVVLEGGARVLKPMQFGLVPFFEKNARPKKVLHNARSETLAEKASFRKPFAETRCLVPMDSFLEYIWDSETSNWLARFGPETEQVLTAAGLWSRWHGPDGAATDSFTVITREPPAFIRGTGHDRCPVFLPESAFAAWLDPGRKEPADLSGVLAQVEPIRFAVERVEKPRRGAARNLELDLSP
jgi:putative SOS response-associated peptidase YedK